VQGVVLNAATGQPLPRVLVKVEDTGALTDGEGRFEIPGVPVGLQTITATKPGFRGQGSSYRGFDSNAYHLVRVADKMPELSFSLAPTNTLSGHVTLSTGDPAVGIGIQLLRQSVEDGRANWNLMDVHPTNPEGEYRFAGLEDGTYLAMTLPAFDNDLTAPSAQSPHAPLQLPGYPIAFFADAADAAGASRIPLAGGQQGTANFTLALSPFHAIAITVAKPRAASHWQFTSSLQDRSGQKLNYPLLYDEKSSTFRAYLPDGSYTLTVEGNNLEGPERDDLPLSRQRNRPATSSPTCASCSPPTLPRPSGCATSRRRPHGRPAHATEVDSTQRTSRPPWASGSSAPAAATTRKTPTFPMPTSCN
jgi:hypothetical protein